MQLQITIPVPSFGTWPGACDRVEFSEALLSSMFVGRGGEGERRKRARCGSSLLSAYNGYVLQSLQSNEHAQKYYTNKQCIASG
jgi:hypothetical protein